MSGVVNVLLVMAVPGILMLLVGSAFLLVWLDEHVKSGPARVALDRFIDWLDLKRDVAT